MIVNVEVEVELSAQEVIERLFPNSRYNPGEYDLLWISGNTDYGRKPIAKVTARLRKKLIPEII